MEISENSSFKDEESNKRFQTFLNLFEGVSSRRVALGTGLGLFASAVALRPEAVFPTAEAAPQDIRGSGNIFVKAFHNKRGQYRLCSDGSIVDSGGGRIQEDPQSRWPLNPRYPKPPALRGQAAGSPWVAVDVVQDTQGTHVLYADGSVRTPGVDEVSAPPVAELQAFTLYDPSPHFQSAGARPYYAGMTRNGNRFTFETPFREPPQFLFFDVLQGGTAFYCTGHNDVGRRFRVTTTYAEHFGIAGRANIMALMIGEVDVEG